MTNTVETTGSNYYPSRRQEALAHIAALHDEHEDHKATERRMGRLAFAVMATGVGTLAFLGVETSSHAPSPKVDATAALLAGEVAGAGASIRKVMESAQLAADVAVTAAGWSNPHKRNLGYDAPPAPDWVQTALPPGVQWALCTDRRLFYAPVQLLEQSPESSFPVQ
jgi:hypothetical protein